MPDPTDHHPVPLSANICRAAAETLQKVVHQCDNAEDAINLAYLQGMAHAIGYLKEYRDCTFEQMEEAMKLAGNNLGFYHTPHLPKPENIAKN